MILDTVKPTERLYFEDAYLRVFDARVVALVELDGQPAVVLDATAFYPEGGGQPADHGVLGGVTVRDVRERDGVIFHVLDGLLAVHVGDRITGEVDWQRRFDHMQQHTGQHTLSAAFYRLLNASTHSWHLGREVVTIDIDGADLPETAFTEAEHAANEILWQDVPVTACIYMPEEFARLEMRKGTDRDGSIRVVSIGDWDRIGCGGTHVASAGQVGAIGVRRWETRGQLTRVEFVCGARALADYHVKTRAINAACAALRSRPDELYAQIERLLSQGAAQRREISDLRQQLIAFEARELLAHAVPAQDGRPLVRARIMNRDANELRFLARRIADSGGVALIGGVAGGKAQLVFACDRDAPLDLNRLLQDVLPLIEGRGGGQRMLAQGGGSGLDGLDAALDQAFATLCSL